MISKLFTKQNLLACADGLKRKNFKPGFDGMSMIGARSWIEINGDRLCREIIKGRYKPLPAIGFRVAKHSGGFRKLSRITATDTIIQNHILNELKPLSEEKFSDNSFAYRQGRGVTQAVERFVLYANQYRFILKMDFNACFDNIDHQILEKSLEEFIEDADLLKLCMSFVKTPLYIDDEVVPNEKGLLQGMPLSPLFCNIYFHNADRFLTELNVPFIRYADDLVVFGNSAEESQELCKKLYDFFEKQLAITCNKRKTKIDTPTKTEFLGYRFKVDKKGIIAISSEMDNVSIYPTWHSRRPENNYRQIDIVSDGILKQKNFSLLFDTETVDSHIPVANTDIINVYSDVVFDSGTIARAAAQGVTINIFDKYGECVGSFVPDAPLKSPSIYHQQLLEYYDEEKRVELAKEFVLASLHNTNIVIRYYNKQNPDKEYQKVLNRLQKLKVQIKEIKSVEELLMVEEQIRKEYYSCFDLFIKREEFVFEKRSKRPPQNEVNALISFGNTVLYNYIATEIQKVGLDIRIGYLHATNKRLKTLNLDIAEIFKPLVVDRVVFSLINKKEINLEHFSRSEKGAVYLTAEGKRVFLKAFYNKLNAELNIKSQNLNYKSVIVEEARKLVRHFRHTEKYKAYRQVR